jgi:hypothetical protein
MSERAGSTVVEVAGSHAIYVSQPAAVADVIKGRVFITGSGNSSRRVASLQPLR